MSGKSFGQQWDAVHTLLRANATHLRTPQDAVLKGSFIQMSIQAPAIIIYLEPSDAAFNESGIPFAYSATCSVYLVTPASNYSDEFKALTASVEHCKRCLDLVETEIEDAAFPTAPIQIDDVQSTHVVTLLTFTLPFV